LDAITLETLRLGTPFFLPRVVPEEGVEIEGNFIPGGTIVAVAAYSQQISEANFHPNPQDFIPERWLQSNHGESTGIRRSALGSFSFGPYACVAKRFAMQEVRHVLARLILTFDMEFV
ncbi:cytochrome P450, partial [Stereum hirsutum FP-91666 SS1]|uniref:cytochrome P450 n=1 Tax=Stereum hirsutum (strain FP-91666) TaxID=721885 RepID=UPI0004449F15